MNSNLKVINLFGAPSAGKSTAMLGLTYLMKVNKFSVESTPEFAKELAIEKRHNIFGQQLFILGEQSKRLEVLKGQYEFAVTDCPLQLISFYTPADYIKSFQPLVDEYFATYENINYFIRRSHDFEVEGRIHNEEESLVLSDKLEEFLLSRGVKYNVLDTSQDVVAKIFEDIKLLKNMS